MGDPARLSSTTADQAVRELLRLARAPAPTGLRERAAVATLQAFAAPAAAAGASAFGGGAKASALTTVHAAKASLLTTVHWVGVACFVGAGTAAGIAASRPPSEPTLAATQAVNETVPRGRAGKRTQAAAAPASEWSPGPVEVTSLPVAPAESAFSAPLADGVRMSPASLASSPPAPAQPEPTPDEGAPDEGDPAAPEPAPRSGGASGPRLSLEVESVDLARKALAGRDPQRALTLLGDFDVRFPDAVLAPEAAVLRIEALVKTGRRREAARIARDVIEQDPDGARVARVRALLGAANR